MSKSIWRHSRTQFGDILHIDLKSPTEGLWIAPSVTGEWNAFENKPWKARVLYRGDLREAKHALAKEYAKRLKVQLKLAEGTKP